MRCFPLNNKVNNRSWSQILAAGCTVLVVLHWNTGVMGSMGATLIGSPPPDPWSRPGHFGLGGEVLMLCPREWGKLGKWVLRQRQTTWRGHQAWGSRVPGMLVAREDAWTSEATSPLLSEEVPFAVLPFFLCPCLVQASAPSSPLSAPHPGLVSPGHRGTPSTSTCKCVTVSLYCTMSSQGLRTA